MATTRTTKRKVPTRTARKAAPRRKGRAPRGFLCRFPFCGRFQRQFRRRTLRLVNVDLFNPGPGNPNRVWATIPAAQLSPQGRAAAMRALRAAAVNGAFDFDCLEVGCSCVLSGRWGPWTRWARGPIQAGFSIPAPNPPPARLRYRANGTVVSRSRFQPGTCYQVRVDA